MTIKMPVLRKIKATEDLKSDEIYLEIEEPGHYALRIEETNV